MGKGKKVEEGAGRPDLPGVGTGPGDPDRVHKIPTDRQKKYRGGKREGKLDGEDRKDGETRDKWLVT